MTSRFPVIVHFYQTVGIGRLRERGGEWGGVSREFTETGELVFSDRTEPEEGHRAREVTCSCSHCEKTSFAHL